jgi:hypothetical protein
MTTPDKTTVTCGAELVPAAQGRTFPPGVAVVAGELLDRACRELPMLAELGEREQLLAAAWLASLRSARTRRAYFTDLGNAGLLAPASGRRGAPRCRFERRARPRRLTVKGLAGKDLGRAQRPRQGRPRCLPAP